MTTRKPRAMPAKGTALVTVSALTAEAHALWVEIRTLYVTSPEAPTLEALGQRYTGRISYEAIRRKAQEESWVAQREEWWTRAETTLLQRIQDEYLAERLDEMRAIRQAKPFVLEHMMPIMEDDPDRPGEKRPKRDPETGMPVFRHGFRSQEGVVKTFLLLQERQMLLRGEATTRAAAHERERTPEMSADPFDQIAAKANFSPGELRTLARELVRRRMVEAEVAASGTLPSEEEEEEDDGDDEI